MITLFKGLKTTFYYMEYVLQGFSLSAAIYRERQGVGHSGPMSSEQIDGAHVAKLKTWIQSVPVSCDL